MIPSPIRKVLSTFRRRRVRALLMGGQACVLYGAAEFSRDVDFLVDPADANVERLRSALRELRAEQVFVPALDAGALRRGHACHFRCHVSGAKRLRIDLMSRIRGGPAFASIWKRRRSLGTPGVGRINVLSQADLVVAKKTQRDKDWPMIARLVEVHYRTHAARPLPAHIRFWLLEARSAELLLELTARFRRQAVRLASTRPALRAALAGRADAVRRALVNEEQEERRADRRYWAPLREELDRWRRARHAEVRET